MRNYLADFFPRIEIASEDAEHLLSAYNVIASDERAFAVFNEALALYDTDMNCDFKLIVELADKAAEVTGIQEFTAEFIFLAALSRRLKENYAARGLSDELFYHTMLDLKYKLEECKLVRGIVGTFVPGWFGGFFNMTRFALGRMQFEMKDFGESYEKDGRALVPESRVINMHIPRSLKPLNEASCDEAFALAAKFFAGEAGESPAFVCNSWLLYPENKKILSPASNTYKFIERFDIIRTSVDKNLNNLWRIFDTDERNPAKLPADTSMRRAFAEHLLSGGKMGTAYGVFFY